jgi:hypothetical protein
MRQDTQFETLGQDLENAPNTSVRAFVPFQPQRQPLQVG